MAETDYIFVMVIELADCALAFHVTDLAVNIFIRFATIVFELFSDLFFFGLVFEITLCCIL